MPLAGFQVPRRRIELPGGDHFEVKGLSVSDFGSLIRLHLDDMEAIRKIVVENVRDAETLDKSRLNNIGMSLINQVPLCTATIIALAADDISLRDDAIKLPLWVQFDALTKVAGLTFKDIAGLKLMMTTVGASLKSVLGAQSEPSSKAAETRRSSRGTGGSGRTRTTS